MLTSSGVKAKNLKVFFFYNTWLEFVIVTQVLRNVLPDCALSYQKQVQSKGKDSNKVRQTDPICRVVYASM